MILKIFKFSFEFFTVFATQSFDPAFILFGNKTAKLETGAGPRGHAVAKNYLDLFGQPILDWWIPLGSSPPCPFCVFIAKRYCGLKNDNSSYSTAYSYKYILQNYF